LAFVESGVAHLNRSNAQRPQVTRCRFNDGEATVVGVRRLAERQDVQVAFTYPRDLQIAFKRKEKTKFLIFFSF